MKHTNIIRTQAIELDSIPAIAHKQKLTSGGAGLKLQRLDQEASAVFTLDKRTGEAIPYGTYNEELFPAEAVLEALELTQGLPYAARGKISVKVTETETADPEDVTEDEKDQTDMVESDEYRAIVSRYSNELGKLNYTLMNKDFIQFAAKSKVVETMITARALAGDILLFIIKSRATFLSGKKESLTDAQTAALIETMDEIDPRSAFKELNAWIRRRLGK